MPSSFRALINPSFFRQDKKSKKNIFPFNLKHRQGATLKVVIPHFWIRQIYRVLYSKKRKHLLIIITCIQRRLLITRPGKTVSRIEWSLNPIKICMQSDKEGPWIKNLIAPVTCFLYSFFSILNSSVELNVFWKWRNWRMRHFWNETRPKWTRDEINQGYNCFLRRHEPFSPSQEMNECCRRTHKKGILQKWHKTNSN